MGQLHVLTFIERAQFTLKALLVITQNNCQHKNLLGNEQWRAVDGIKHLRNSSLEVT